jgi:hypothetical protein
MGSGPPKGNESWCAKADGTKHGKYTSWYKGTAIKESEGNYRDGKQEGQWTFWHNNGKISSSGEFKDGMHQGKWIIYYINGQKAAESEYNRDLLHGAYSQYFKNGQKWTEGQYKDGQKSGHWIFYCEDGTKKQEGDLVDGVSVDDSVRVYKECANPEADGEGNESDEDGEQEANNDQSSTSSEQDSAVDRQLEVKRKYLQSRMVVNRGRGKNIAHRAERVAKDFCAVMSEKAALTKRFEKECSLKPLEKVGDLEVGTSERMCPRAKQLEYVTKFAAQDKSIKEKKKEFQPLDVAAYAVGNEFLEQYSEFVRAAVDCYCPDPETGTKGPCSD